MAPTRRLCVKRGGHGVGTHRWRRLLVAIVARRGHNLSTSTSSFVGILQVSNLES